MTRSDIKELLNQKPDYRSKLFERGFLLTDDQVDDTAYPFFGLWKKDRVAQYTILTSPEQSCFIERNGMSATVLIGHAYDPTRGIADEHTLLVELHLLWRDNRPNFWDRVCDLSGNYTLVRIDEENLFVVGDATGMQTTFYCRENGHSYISSHTNCIGDLLELEWDPYVRRLVDYRFFHLFGNTLPGDLTQFLKVKRLVPNHYVYIQNGAFVSQRFYWPKKHNKTNEQIAQNTAALLNKSLDLISKKWKRPAISLTGGCDSKTTLACADGMLDRFSYYSYDSSDSEKVDAEAARAICTVLGVPHTVYQISEADADFPEIETARAILFWNSGGICMPNRNDVRKRCFFSNLDAFDVEVKSWASEIGRAYYAKRFAGRMNFGALPTARKCTTMYKVFFHDRKLVRDTDRVFTEYLCRYFQRASEDPIAWEDQFFWEFRVASWNGLVITGEHNYSDTIVIPYNNRRILELLLSASPSDRFHDTVYSLIRRIMKPEIGATGIAVTNVKHTSMRAIAENLYYTVHTNIRF